MLERLVGRFKKLFMRESVVDFSLDFLGIQENIEVHFSNNELHSYCWKNTLNGIGLLLEGNREEF